MAVAAPTVIITGNVLRPSFGNSSSVLLLQWAAKKPGCPSLKSSKFHCTFMFYPPTSIGWSDRLINLTMYKYNSFRPKLTQAVFGDPPIIPNPSPHISKHPIASHLAVPEGQLEPSQAGWLEESIQMNAQPGAPRSALRLHQVCSNPPPLKKWKSQIYVQKSWWIHETSPFFWVWIQFGGSNWKKSWKIYDIWYIMILYNII